MDELSLKQKEIFEVIKKMIEKNGYSPSLEEIAEKVNLKNKSCVKPHIEKLKQKGYINYIEGKSRTITINKGDEK